MRMTKCKRCGKVYPLEMTHCPECFTRTTLPPDQIVLRLLLVFIVIFTVPLIVNTCLGDRSDTISSESPSKITGNNTETTKPIEYIEVSASDLFAAFQENEIAADEKYTGKPVKVAGTINSINSKSGLTSANILLDVEGMFFLGCVQCNFNSENAKVLANVEKGQAVTIVGTCNGLSLYNVIISACELQP